MLRGVCILWMSCLFIYLFICPYTKPWISASTRLWRQKSCSSIHHRNSSLPGQPKTARSCCLAHKSWFFCKVQRSSACLASFTAECACCHGSLREPGLIQAGSIKVLYISSLAITQCQASSSAGSLGSSTAHLHGKSKTSTRISTEVHISCLLNSLYCWCKSVIVQCSTGSLLAIQCCFDSTGVTLVPCNSEGYVFVFDSHTVCMDCIVYLYMWHNTQASIVYDFCINTCRVVWWPLSG